jgi:hypothetical protein
VALSEIFPLLAIDLEQLLTIQGRFDLAAQLSCWRSGLGDEAGVWQDSKSADQEIDAR